MLRSRRISIRDTAPSAGLIQWAKQPFCSLEIMGTSLEVAGDPHLVGNVVEGGGAPNREVYIHSKCYRTRSDVGVCDTHSPMVRLFDAPVLCQSEGPA